MLTWAIAFLAVKFDNVPIILIVISMVCDVMIFSYISEGLSK